LIVPVSRRSHLCGTCAIIPSGCIGRLGDGRLVAYDLAHNAFEEDCRRAALIVTTREPPPDCAAQVVGRALLRQRGSLALRRDGAGFAIEAVRSAHYDRPWSPQRVQKAAADSNATTSMRPQIAPRDATPQPEDIEADQ
jgi:competence protein ComEC